MRISLLILATASSLAGVIAVPATAKDKNPLRSLDPVNVPVVTRQDFLFDAASPDGSLSAVDLARLDGWFRGLDLGYGDSVYVQGNTGSALNDVARVAGSFGMFVAAGGPVLPSTLVPGSIRVIVVKSRATVPGCPNWREGSEPNYGNHQQSNFGCGVNSNLAAMIANPQDLIYGREGAGTVDAQTAVKAIQSYRAQKPTGESGLKDITTKGN